MISLRIQCLNLCRAKADKAAEDDATKNGSLYIDKVDKILTFFHICFEKVKIAKRTSSPAAYACTGSGYVLGKRQKTYLQGEDAESVKPVCEANAKQMRRSRKAPASINFLILIKYITLKQLKIIEDITLIKT